MKKVSDKERERKKDRREGGRGGGSDRGRREIDFLSSRNCLSFECLIILSTVSVIASVYRSFCVHMSILNC